MRKIYGLISFVAVMMIMLSGCAWTRHATHVDKSGFLGEELYEKLTPGDPSKGEFAALRWVDPNESGIHPNLKRIILDHIVLYRQPQHFGGGESNEASQELLNYFYNKMYTELSKRYEIVDMLGPGTIRIQIAVTDYEQSWVALDMISTVVPQLRAVSTLKMLATEKPAFVGAAQIEFKITEAQTGKIVAAAVDRRVGGKTLGKGFGSWADVQHAFDWWSALTAYRLCVTTGGSNCPEKPKA